MGKKLRKKKKNNRNRKQNQQKKTNTILKQIENLALEEKNDDFISRLQDDILCHILSLVPCRCAVQTSLLSSRWRYVWRKSIEFQGTIDDISEVITLLLDRFDKLSSDRKIRFHFGEGSILATFKDEELHLNFCYEGQETFSHFDWSLELNPKIPVCERASCMKVLHLKSVNKMTREIVSSVISKFQFLENLQISECKGLQSLYIEAGSRFQSLIILDCLQLNEIYVFAHNLKKLVFQGQLPWIWLYYSPHLENAILDFRNGPGYNPFACENLLSLLLAVKNVKTLTISGWLFRVPISKWLSSAGAIWERKDFLFNNLMKLCWIDSSMENHSIATLISVLKICPSLEKLFINVDPSNYCSPSKGEYSFWIEYSNRVASTTTLDHLTVVKLKGSLGQEDKILLTKLLVKVASVELIQFK
ncbi:F-box protein At2g39490-like [Durio zibethinus]|uniref:F-box protein At2g39490-like n=1 Tax=Durio zibethinus TaxID=66656 RepID=A0A6P6AI43_DURZI|nr:F-box protein At2g39490-like [Durio zibethinus]